MTSRDCRVVGSEANLEIALTAMDVLDAEKLFLRIQGTNSDRSWQRPSAHPEYRVIRLIVEELHCFPLAIDQAALSIRENSLMTVESI